MQERTVVKDHVINLLLLFPHIMKRSEAVHFAGAEAAVGARSAALWLQGPLVLTGPCSNFFIYSGCMQRCSGASHILMYWLVIARRGTPHTGGALTQERSQLFLAGGL